jgi:CheY-like chemotaxis protein
LQLEAADLASLVRGMSGLIQRSIGASVEIEMKFPPGLPPVRTDSAQFEASLLNLVVNARDAMPEGGSIVVSAEPESLAQSRLGLSAGDYVRLTVADAGEGMDAATLARATEPFFTTKGVGKGTGLGLSMAQGLAAQSGGALTIDSRPGEGTRVNVWLPVADRAPAEDGEERGLARGFSTELRALTLLAVDDDALVLTNTGALLEDLGHRVLRARSGAEALKVLNDNTDIDLVITDQVMPHMTGLALRREIAKRRPELPVLIATGFAELPPDAETDLRRISKPFTQAELADAVFDTMMARV